jgi:hypothetical protein
MPLNEHTYRNLLASYTGANLIGDLPDALLDLWDDDYRQTHANAELLTVTLEEHGSSFTFLFDTTRQRTIGAVGLPAFIKHGRDKTRMAGHPLSQGSAYHRGHLMAHSIGGGADINLVPQLGKVNNGKFKSLEYRVRKLAEQHVSCVYFVRTIYPSDTAVQTFLTQMPDRIEQGVVQVPHTLHYAIFDNL